MSLAKERPIAHESFMMNALNPMSPQSSPYSSPEAFDGHVEKRPNETAFGAASNNDSSEDGQSVINFSSFLNISNNSSDDQSLLSFDQKEEELYAKTNQSCYQWNNYSSCFQTTASDCSMNNKRNQNGSAGGGSDGSYAWLYSDQSTITADHSFDESGSQESPGYNKRPNMGESTQAVKKQCTSTNSATNNSKKAKVQKPCTVSKDPQSIAAKNRRERISERLKVLQELVPNGSKVDLVTMLEKAISYVKFLQLQVKVLATDDFWPVQGGKAPDISQVREAIDAILSSSSQRERNTSTN